MYQRPDGGLSRISSGKTSLKIVKEREQVAALFRPRWRVYAMEATKAAALAVLLAAGTIWTLEHQHPSFTRPAELMKLPGAVISAKMPSEEAFRISQVLRRYTRSGDVADRIADAVVREGRRKKIDPALLVGVMLVESDNLNPRARSFMGARGLMQVMPFHRGQWGCKSTDLYSIEGNICHGVSVLADAIKHAPNLRTALQRYNGCVSGSNTPGCRSYSGKVMNATNRTARQMMTLSDEPQGQE
ncbi:MAG TPA: transglycosylase SLT domain-containing protein [Gemmatimonadaceae bacterium]|nr:transglycosylase SLT domain-containing protein [Gemmatimonadaceae bacterium]